MAKGYLLLRNNKQTGPHNFDELLQLQLKPFDLVWAEGRSAAWRYPGEIEELRSFVPELETLPQHEASNITTKKYTEPEVTNFIETRPKAIPSAKHIHVSLPLNKQSYAQPVPPPTSYAIPEKKVEDFKIYKEDTIRTQQVQQTLDNKYSRSLNDVEEDYTDWVFKQKTKKKNFLQSKNFTAALLVVGVMAISYFAVQLMSSKTPVSSSAIATQSQQSSIPSSQIDGTAKTRSITTSAISKPPSKKIKKTIEKKPAVNVKKSQLKIQAIKSKPVETVSAKKGNVEIKNSEPVISEKKQEPVSQQEKAPKEKKKKLGDILKGVIDKFKSKKTEVKKDPPITEDQKPAIDRKTTRREDAAPSNENNIEASALAGQIDISGNTPNNGWMMGVMGLKVTLRNRSNFILKTASVEVLYFDENDKLLEKKIIFFYNVPAKGKQTVVAPDQKFTDHTEYKLGALSIKDDRYAKQ